MAADKTSDLAKDDMEQQTGYKRSDWYLPDITEVGELAREVLEKYSHISPDEVVPHVLAIVRTPLDENSISFSVEFSCTLFRSISLIYHDTRCSDKFHRGSVRGKCGTIHA